MNEPAEPPSPPGPDTTPLNEPEMTEASVGTDTSTASGDVPVQHESVPTNPALSSFDTFTTYASSMPSTAPPRRRGIPGSLWLLAVLIPYAIVATLAVLYLLQQHHQGQPQPHILESIPDQGLYEDFLDGRRREVVPEIAKASERPPPTKVIPAHELLPTDTPPLKFGETRRVGDLAVTPLGVTRQTLRFDYKNGQKDVPGAEALVLKLQVKNEGKLIFRPDDETFNRAFLEDQRVPVYTYLQAGKQRFYGAVADPAQERLSLPACGPLLPGETGTIYVTSVHGADGKTLITEALSAPDPLLWRVQLRRGKEEVTMANGRKRSVWVTAVIGVHVPPNEIKQDKPPR